MEARVDISKVLFTKLPSKKIVDSNTLLSTIKQVEKRAFPTNEAFDFASELSKRTTNLYCAYIKPPKEQPELLGYAVYVRSKLVRIHKVCVVERYRRQKVGTWMLQQILDDLKKGGAGKVDLWVDTSRHSARQLYKKCGFVEKEMVNDYYAPSRDAVRMEIDLAGNN